MYRYEQRHNTDIPVPTTNPLEGFDWRAKIRRQTVHTKQNSISGYPIENFEGDRESSPDVRQKIGDAVKGEHDIRFENHASGHFNCNCKVCEIEKRNKRQTRSVQREAEFFHNFSFELNNDSEKDFVFILKRLFPPKPMPYTIRLFIPETVAFIDGEAKFIVYSEKEKRIKYIKTKEKLTLAEIRKFFQESQKRKENELLALEEKDFGKPSWNKKDLIGKDKLDNMSVFEEAILGEFKRSTTLRIRQARKVSFTENSTNKEVALAKFKDDTTTAMTETELNHILLRRKNDPFWMKIQYLQSYIRTRKGMQTMQRVYFVYERDKDDPLFLRSLTEIRYLNGDIPKASTEFIPLHEEERFEEELMQKDLRKFYLYLLMKVFHFIEVMHNLRILKMGGDFTKDQYNFTWLMNISRVQYEVLPTVEQEFAGLHETLQQDHANIGSIVIEEHGEQKSQKSRINKKLETLNKLNTEIKSHYEKLKQNTGMEVQEDSSVDENTTQIYAAGEYKFYSPKNSDQKKQKGRALYHLSKLGPINLKSLPTQSTPKGSYKSNPQPVRTYKLEKLSIGSEAEIKEQLGGHNVSGLKDRFYLVRSIDLTARKGPKPDTLRASLKPHSYSYLQSLKDQGNSSRLTTVSRVNTKPNERYNTSTNDEGMRNMYTVESTQGERNSCRDSIEEPLKTQETRVNMRMFDVRRSEMVDFSRRSSKENKHLQWIREFNNGIKQRVSAQLTNRNVSTGHKEYNSRRSYHYADMNL